MTGHVLSWLLLAEVLAWAWCILAWPLFSAWPDRGVGLSKAAGTLMLGVTLWVAVRSGLAALTPSAGWAVASAIVLVAAGAAVRRRTALAAFFSSNPAAWIVPQAVWLLVIVVFLALRAADPDILGAEKFMDLAFLNAAVRTRVLPPADPWLSGFAVGYYHFGYATWAAFAEMLATPVAVGYNLALSLVPASVAAVAYSVALAMSRSRRAALVSTLALTFFGTLAGTAQLGSVGSGYDVWAPTRVITGTINEFPFFTFFWGDLHPHLLAMPNFVVYVGLAFALFETRRHGARGTLVAALVGISAGMAAATSSWDVVPLGILVLAVQLVRCPSVDIRQLVLECAVAAGCAMAVALPASTTSVRDLTVGLAARHSPLGGFLLVHGVWLLPAVLLYAERLSSTVHRSHDRWTIVFAVAAAAVGGAVTASLTIALLSAFVVGSWRTAWQSRPAFPWLLVATGVTMLLLSEVVFVDDIYGRDLERVNSVFKFHLHACLLLGLCWGACSLELWRPGRHLFPRSAFVGILAFAAAAAAVYPVGAILDRTSRASGLTLDGARHLERTHGGDAGLIRFLNREVPGTPVIAEATGAAYSYSSRISTYTGLPTIIGWSNHQRVWRRGAEASAEIDRRVAAVRELYEGDTTAASRVIAAYGVRYVIVGEFERQTYARGDFEKFARLGRTIYDAGGTRLFDVGEPRPRS